MRPASWRNTSGVYSTSSRPSSRTSPASSRCPSTSLEARSPPAENASKTEASCAACNLSRRVVHRSRIGGTRRDLAGLQEGEETRGGRHGKARASATGQGTAGGRASPRGPGGARPAHARSPGGARGTVGGRADGAAPPAAPRGGGVAVGGGRAGARGRAGDLHGGSPAGALGQRDVDGRRVRLLRRPGHGDRRAGQR